MQPSNLSNEPITLHANYASSFVDTFWLRIVIACATVSDLADSSLFPSLHPADTKSAQAVHKTWLSQFNNSNTILKARLAQLGFKKYESDFVLSQIVGDHGWTDKALSLPWVKSIENWIIKPWLSKDFLNQVVLANIGHNKPFRDFILSYAQKIHETCSAKFTYKAIVPLQQATLSLAFERLSVIMIPVLIQDYRRFKRFINRKLGNRLPDSRLLAVYENQLKDGGYLTLYKTYPVLARLIANECTKAVNLVDNFVADLDSSWPILQKEFAGLKDLGSIRDIQFGLSDSHNGGLTVAIVKTDAMKLVYKPRSLKTAEVLQGLLFELNKDNQFQFHTRKIVDCGQFGWEEFIGNAPCHSIAAVRQFFHHAGAFQALALMLGMSDCNIENIKCDGGRFNVIDAETLCFAPIKIFGNLSIKDNAGKRISRNLRRSILSTGLLPAWGFNKDGENYFGGAGLWSAADDEAELAYKIWQDPKITGKYFHKRVKKARRYENLPVFKKEECGLVDYQDEFVNGFNKAFDKLKEVYSSPINRMRLESQIADLKFRVILKNTANYEILINRLRNPKLLSNGLRWSLQSESLFRRSTLESHSMAIVKKEIESLLNLEVPYFEAATTSARLWSNRDEEPIANCLEHRPIDELKTQIGNFSDDFKAAQIQVFKSIVDNNFNRYKSKSHSFQEQIAALDSPALIQSGIQNSFHAAKRVADVLREKKIVGDDGSVNWLTLETQGGSPYRVLNAMPLNLYSGTLGPSLLMAAIFKVTGDPEFKRLSIAATKSTMDLIRNEPRVGSQLIELNFPGQAVGAGGLLYGLTCLGQILDEPSYLEGTLGLIKYIDVTKPAWQQSSDLVSGQAGLLIGLMKLYEITDEKELLVIGKSVSTNLRKQSRRADGGVYWPTKMGRYMTGLSHGNSGIALALSRYYYQSEDETVLPLISAALKLEDEQFIPAQNNWKDNRWENIRADSKCIFSWCHGAPGILASRLSIKEATGLPLGPLTTEVLEATQSFPEAKIDHLCCGNMGRISLGISIANAWGQKNLMKDSNLRLEQLIERVLADRIVVSDTTADNSLFPGFFQGISGIGYELLRLNAPDALPNILLVQ